MSKHEVTNFKNTASQVLRNKTCEGGEKAKKEENVTAEPLEVTEIIMPADEP